MRQNRSFYTRTDKNHGFCSCLKYRHLNCESSLARLSLRSNRAEPPQLTHHITLPLFSLIPCILGTLYFSDTNQYVQFLMVNLYFSVLFVDWCAQNELEGSWSVGLSLYLSILSCCRVISKACRKCNRPDGAKWLAFCYLKYRQFQPESGSLSVRNGYK